jgi:hypothetical protein
MNDFATDLDVVLADLRQMLVAKNKAYGDSALQPLRVFSQADPVEQLKVRLDDKISRLARGKAAGEDVETDLLGYLVLLRIARRRAGDGAAATADGENATDAEMAFMPEVAALGGTWAWSSRLFRYELRRSGDLLGYCEKLGSGSYKAWVLDRRGGEHQGGAYDTVAEARQTVETMAFLKWATPERSAATAYHEARAKALHHDMTHRPFPTEGGA